MLLLCLEYLRNAVTNNKEWRLSLVQRPRLTGEITARALGAVRDAGRCDAAVAIASINLHRGNVPSVRRLNQLRISLRIAMKGLPGFPAIPGPKQSSSVAPCFLKSGFRPRPIPTCGKQNKASKDTHRKLTQVLLATLAPLRKELRGGNGRILAVGSRWSIHRNQFAAGPVSHRIS